MGRESQQLSLAEEDVAFIRTMALVPNAVNTFIAWVDYTGEAVKWSFCEIPAAVGRQEMKNPLIVWHIF